MLSRMRRPSRRVRFGSDDVKNAKEIKYIIDNLKDVIGEYVLLDSRIGSLWNKIIDVKNQRGFREEHRSAYGYLEAADNLISKKGWASRAEVERILKQASNELVHAMKSENW